MLNVKYKNFEQNIGYSFRDKELLRLALTHRSKGKVNNERLEFLGDSILNFVVSRELYLRFPGAAEGDLTRLRSQLVCGDMLAQLAHKLAVSDYLILGSGELRTGGHKRQSVLADAIEAVIGAIYLDADVEAARQIILSWYEDSIVNLDPLAADKDAKTKLQELMQARQQALPEYEVVAVTGKQHEQHFHVECRAGAEVTAGTGSSRRKAEQIAAASMFAKLEDAEC